MAILMTYHVVTGENSFPTKRTSFDLLALLYLRSDGPHCRTAPCAHKQPINGPMRDGQENKQ
jgi:hypothetical protein